MAKNSTTDRSPRPVRAFAVPSAVSALSALAVFSAFLAGPVSAATIYETAKVVDVKPVYEIVSTTRPREVCRTEQVTYRDYDRPRSATGPILGAIIGGALGNAVGHNKRNKQVGTAVGAILGGSVGADIARRNRNGGTRVGNREVCSVVNDVQEEERLSHYQVSYSYGGQVLTTRMDRDPGDSIEVEVRVNPAG